MPKLLKSEHLNDELGKTERDLKDARETWFIAKLGVKVVILIAKLIRDIRHNQITSMKSNGIKLYKGKTKEGVNNEQS